MIWSLAYQDMNILKEAHNVEGEKMIESVYNESRNGGHIARGYLIELMKNRLINCQFMGGIHLFINISALFNCKLVISQCL